MIEDFYAVKRGRIPGIYTSWKECEEQIKGFSDAKFKKFRTKELAEEYINVDSELQTELPRIGLAVDASLLKNNIGEYQIYDINLGKIIHNSRIYQNTTVNIMEFLAIMYAIKLSSTDPNYINIDIYSDSATAITWIHKKAINSKSIPDEDTQKEIQECIDYLNNSTFANRIIKWSTQQLKDIPADFSRK